MRTRGKGGHGRPQALPILRLTGLAALGTCSPAPQGAVTATAAPAWVLVRGRDVCHLHLLTWLLPHLLCVSTKLPCLHPVPLGPRCAYLPSRTHACLTRELSSPSAAGPPRADAGGTEQGSGLRATNPPRRLFSLGSVTRGTESSGGTAFGGTHHKPLEGSFGEKKKNNHRLFLLGLF